jgi:uncharacterized protein (DUF2147 family)
MRGLTKKMVPVLMLLVSVVGIHVVKAQSDKIEGVWLNEEKDAKIQIYKARDGKFYGKIVWLKDPTENGKPKTDKKNPKDQMKTQPLVELVILKGFNMDGNTYEDGTIYDPNNGKTYDCKMTYKGKTLAIRGFIGLSLFGRTTIWERAGS